MVLIFQPDFEPDPGQRYINDELNLRDLFVLPLGMWSKKKPLHPLEPLKLPVTNVIVSWTNSNVCEKEGECVQNMWDLQKHYQDRGQDIPYNFVVAGDANVYECRGWRGKPAKCDRHPDLDGTSIEIAHMGYRKPDGARPPVGMCLSVWKLCDWAIEKGYIIDKIQFRPDYEVLYGTMLSKANRDNLENDLKASADREKEYDRQAEEAFKNPGKTTQRVEYPEFHADIENMDFGEDLPDNVGPEWRGAEEWNKL